MGLRSPYAFIVAIYGASLTTNYHPNYDRLDMKYSAFTLTLSGLSSTTSPHSPLLPFRMKNLKMSFYLLFVSLGLLISFVSCLLVYLQYSAYIKDTYFDTLLHVSALVESQYPVIHDTARLKQGAAGDEDWFWEMSQGLSNIAASFNLAYVYYIEKTGAGYIFLMSSDISKERNREMLGGPVWLPSTPVPKGIDEAYTAQEPTRSSKPTVNEWGVLVSAAWPIVTAGKTVGLLGAAYNISYIRSLERKALFIVLISFAASAVIVGFIALAGSHSVVVPIREWEHIARRADERRREVESLTAKLRAASASKSAFLANISHEMRTPMNAIIGLSTLMLDEKDVSDNSKENLEIINDSGMMLLSVINDILDINKIEAGKLEILPARYGLPELIYDIAAPYSLYSGERSVRFELRLSEDMPQELFGDRLRIKQMCGKLLDNAFKFTKTGSVVLTVSPERDGGYVWLTVSVQDTGIGVSPEDLARLLAEDSEGYGPLDADANRRAGGTGLGLVIVKRMAAMMDGNLRAESEYGKGSVFVLRLRQKFVNDEVIGPGTAEDLINFRYFSARRDRNQKLARIRIPYAKVLVVDDIPANLKVAQGLLQPYLMQVDCVESGQEAVERIRRAEPKYDMVLMDYMMPEMDGIETTRIIREELGTMYAKTVPIIALTAAEVDSKEEMFLQNGFSSFLAKPIDITRLDAEINRWVRGVS